MEGDAAYLDQLFFSLARWNCDNNTTRLERLAAHYIRFMSCIASGDAAFCLERSESSFVTLAMSNADTYSTFRDLQQA